MSTKGFDSNERLDSSSAAQVGESSLSSSADEHADVTGSNSASCVKTGIDYLRDFCPDTYLQSADRLTWTTWYQRDEIALWQLVALHSYIEPDSISWIEADGEVRLFNPRDTDYEFDPADICGKFHQNLDRAIDAVKLGHLRCVEIAQPPWASMVRVGVFQAWSRAEHLPVIGNLPKSVHAPLNEDYAGSSNSIGRAPWGLHSTPILEWLGRVADVFWTSQDNGGRYDPQNQRTAPTNQEVMDWLGEHWPESSTRVRQLIATALRPPDLPTGPRSQKKRETPHS